LVYALAGTAAAGFYSVALTAGQLVTYISFALAFSAFPRVASLDSEEVVPLIARLSRVNIAASSVGTMVLGISLPYVIPALFGERFTPAVGPSLVLLIGGMFWSEQIVLARLWAARKTAGLTLLTSGTTFITMVCLDLALIDRWGLWGAAIGSTVAPAMGLLVCLRAFHKSKDLHVSLGELLPRWDDYALLGSVVRSGFKNLIARRM
jgi:O-antigen/teichoic acid export membrane protein